MEVKSAHGLSLWKPIRSGWDKFWSLLRILLGIILTFTFTSRWTKISGLEHPQNGMDKKLGGGSTIGYVIEHTSIKD